MFLGVDVQQAGSHSASRGRKAGEHGVCAGWFVGKAIDALPGAEVPPFLIDRHETTNAEYKEFVDAGGYERRSWWEFDIKKDGRPLTFDESMRLFVDATGRAGPAAWELGNYPDGRGNYPVAGISWYEAAAYARFREKSLPTPPSLCEGGVPGTGSRQFTRGPDRAAQQLRHCRACTRRAVPGSRSILAPTTFSAMFASGSRILVPVAAGS